MPHHESFDLLLKEALTGEKLPNIRAIAELLEAGADPNAVLDKMGRRPLHSVAGKGDAAAMLLLLEHGATPDVFDENGMTPLHEAVLAKQFDCADLLLRYKANISARGGFRNEPTPLHSAIYCDQSEGGDSRVAYLLEKGADIAATDGRGHAAIAVANSDMAVFMRFYHIRKKERELEEVSAAVNKGISADKALGARSVLLPRRKMPPGNSL